MSTISIKVGDTARAIVDTLTLGDSAIDLTGATVSLLWKRNGKPLETKSVTVVSATEGSVSYQLTAADVAVPAEVAFSWRIVFADGKPLTIPSGDGGERHTLLIKPQV